MRRFVPLAKDNGQYLACRATNEFFLGRPKEDGYVLDVKCKSQFPVRQHALRAVHTS